MATILSAGTQASASVLNACRSRHSLQQQQQSQQQLCRQGVFQDGSATGLGHLETRNHPQVSYFLKSKQRLRLRATATAELQALVAEEVTETLPDTLSSSDFVSSPDAELPTVDSNELPSQIEDGSSFDVLSSPPLSTEDAPPTTPLVDDIPRFLEAPDASPPPAVDALQSAGEDGSAGNAALSAQEEYLRLIGGGSKQGVEQVQTDDLTAGIGDSLKAAQDSISSAGDAAAKSVEGVVSAVRDAVDNAGSSVKNAYDSVNGSIVRAIKSVTGPFDKSVDNLQSTVDQAPGVFVDFTSVFNPGTPANNSLKEVVAVVKDATGSALGAAGSLVSQAYSITKDNVPTEVKGFLDSAQDKVLQITEPVGPAINRASEIITNAERAVGIDVENPVIPVIFVVGGFLFVGFSSLRSRFGGYAGDIPPSEALAALKIENAVLVDIRSQEAREAEGVPDLRRSTRSKLAIVEVIKVEGAVRGMLRKVSEVESLLTAAVIRNLKNVNGGSKIIVLDSDGSQSRQIARGLRRSGVKRAYLLDGGFKAWASSGLPVRADGNLSPLAVLQEDAEAIVEEVKPTPTGVFAVLLGSVAGAYALYEWEKSLQLIGILGIATSIFSRVSAYETVEDAQADLRYLQKPFSLVIQGIVSVSGLIEPKKLQLATSPVSSNVQGRVIQAAAKHGPISSELELVQEEPKSSTDEVADDEVAEVVQVVEEGETTQSQHTSVQDPE